MRALKEEDAARNELGAAQRKLVHAKARVTELACAVDSLMVLLPEAQRAAYKGQIDQMRPPPKVGHGTTVYETIVAMINMSPETEWTAANLYNAIYRLGFVLEIEQVHNVLNYLARKGRITRTTRGKYVLAGEKKTAGAVVQTTPAA